MRPTPSVKVDGSDTKASWDRSLGTPGCFFVENLHGKFIRRKT